MRDVREIFIRTFFYSDGLGNLLNGSMENENNLMNMFFAKEQEGKEERE